MTIRTKTLGVIALAVLVSAVANLLILRTVVFPSFVELEKAAAEKNMLRVVEAFNSTIDNLDAVVNDYAKWDTTYNYVIHQDIDYIEQNITPDGLERLRICLIGIYDGANKPLVQAFFDFDTDELRPAGDLSFTQLDPSGRLLHLPSVSAVVKGIIPSKQGPVIAASRPILQTNGEGPPAGAFIFGRLVDAEMLQTLQQQTRVNFDVSVLGRDVLPQDLEQHLRDIRQDSREYGTKETADGGLHGYALVRDIYGSPALMIHANFPRDISAIGENALWVSVLGMLLAGLVVMAATGFLLQWILLGPLAQLTGHVLEIGRSGDISRRVALKRSDELGLLGRQFDVMLENLAQARNRLVDQSYRSGIAEMASGVLHNIRNQLAPLVMQLGRLRDQIAIGPDEKIDCALEQLGGGSITEERKDKILRFIRMSMRADSERRCRTEEQMVGLIEDFVRFKAVLQELDRFSRSDNDDGERALLHDVVRETICMLPTFPDVRVTIRADANLETMPPVAGKSFVLQHVLHNLMMNAVEAIAASGRGHGEIRISASVVSLDARSFLELCLHDNGIGIAAATLPDIFARGFTTKTGERRGTGLHWSANCITAMGGKLVAESEGVGKGTRFRLILPVAETATDAAA